MPLSKDLREFIECLNSNEVEYLIVGALAVSPTLANAESRVPGHIDGLRVQFIGGEALIQNKGATGRAKDRIDAAELRRQDRASS